MLKKRLIVIIFILGVILIGPSPDYPDYSAKPTLNSMGAIEVEKHIADRESKLNIKPNNEAQIVWYDPELKDKTEYAVVYLHGFSASHGEGSPIHEAIAKRYGMNLYLARLHDHGIDSPDALSNYNVTDYWKSAIDAINVGKSLGKKIILLGTSAGGAMSLTLASKFPELIHSVLTMSPCIEINNSGAWLLNKPWGQFLTYIAYGGRYAETNETDSMRLQYWSKPYRVEAIGELQQFIEDNMTEATFKKIKQPVWVGAYYRDQAHQDDVVSVAAMQTMFKQLGTDINNKWLIKFPYANHHVIGSQYTNPEYYAVQEEIQTFIEAVLGIEPLYDNEICD